jgi:hypothetical protein
MRRFIVRSTVLFLAAIGVLTALVRFDPWQTRMSLDLNSGDYKIEELLFGHVIRSRVEQGNFSRQLRQYVKPAPLPPNWVGFSWHDHFSGGWGDGTGIGHQCDNVVGWMDVNGTDVGTRTQILRRMAGELAHQDEDAIKRERQLVRGH